MAQLINKIYGVLVNNDSSVDNECFRFSNASRNCLAPAASVYLNKLLPDNMSIIEKAATADTVIRLLQSSDEYAVMVQELDPVNTYDTDCVQSTTCACLPFKTMYEWASQIPITANKVKIDPTDDPITVVQKAFWIILSAK